MTRKEELENLAAEMESDLGLPDTYREYFIKKLTQVEREVIDKVVITLEENKTISPHLGPLWNAGWTSCAKHFAAWFRKQQKELE